MIALKILLFGLSTLGSFEIIRKICDNKIDVYFLPSLTIAIQVTILYFAGILNLLPEMTNILFGLGLGGFAIRIWENKGIKFAKEYLNDGYVTIILILLIMAMCVRGKLFSHYDNFSHWALVVQNMLEVDHYPNFESTLIMFQEYPLGSATYIYYFAKLISTSESVQMLAQIYIITVSILPLYSFVVKRSFKIDCIFLVFANFVFIYNVTVGNLLVDTLLPVVGICGLFFARKYCFSEDNGLFCWLLSCYLVQIIQIKNSGIFFVAVIILGCIRYYWKSDSRISNLCSAVFPFISLLVWHKHCKYVFSSAATSKHAMTVENYQYVFGNKTIEDIKIITTGLFKFAFTYKDFLALFGIVILIGCYICLFNKTYLSDFRKCVVFSIVIYITYQIGMLGMYLFSMPGDAATSLAAKERYTKTIILAILMVYIALVFRTLGESNVKKYVNNVAEIMIIVCILLVSYISQGSIKFVTSTVNNSEKRLWVEENRDKYAIPMYESYCMLVPANNSTGYFRYLMKYIFQSTDVSSKSIKNVDELNSITSKYILVYDDENEIINTWIKEMYPEQLGNDVIIQGDR